MRVIIFTVIFLLYSIVFFTAYFFGMYKGYTYCDIKEDCKYYPDQCPLVRDKILGKSREQKHNKR